MEGDFGDSTEDSMVIRENSPFIPSGVDPAIFGDIATIWKASVVERDMRDWG